MEPGILTILARLVRIRVLEQEGVAAGIESVIAGDVGLEEAGGADFDVGGSVDNGEIDGVRRGGDVEAGGGFRHGGSVLLMDGYSFWRGSWVLDSTSSKSCWKDDLRKLIVAGGILNMLSKAPEDEEFSRQDSGFACGSRSVSSRTSSSDEMPCAASLPVTSCQLCRARGVGDASSRVVTWWMSCTSCAKVVLELCGGELHAKTLGGEGRGG